MRMIRVHVLLLLALTTVSCVSTFNTKETNFKPKGKTLAVIAGLDAEENLVVAAAMSDALRTHSRFQVISDKKVAQSLPGYPQNIKGPYRSAYFDIDVDYTKTDVKKIREIQQKLGVDYLFALWTPTATTVQGKIQMLHIVGQLFEGQASKEVGTARFNATAGRISCCLAPTPGEEDRLQAVKDATAYVAKEMAEKTGMARQER